MKGFVKNSLVTLAGAVPRGGASGPFAQSLILRPRISFDHLSRNHTKIPGFWSGLLKSKSAAAASAQFKLLAGRYGTY